MDLFLIKKKDISKLYKMELKKFSKSLIKISRLKNLLYYKFHISFLLFIYVLWRLRNFTRKRYHNLIRMHKNKRYLTTSFGTIAYIARSPTNMKPKGLIVLIHGFSGSSESMKKIANILVKNGYSIICFDCYGRGCSDGTEFPNCPEIFTSMISQGLFALQVKVPIHIIGYSMGGLIASEYCKIFPHLVKSLTLIAPAGIQTNLPFFLRYGSFYPLGEMFVGLVGYILLKRHYKQCSGKKVKSEINLRKYHCNLKAYYSSLLCSIRNMPWKGYNFSEIKTPKYLVYSSSDDIMTITKDDINKFGNLEYEELHGYTHNKLICSEVGEKISKYIEERVN